MTVNLHQAIKHHCLSVIIAHFEEIFCPNKYISYKYLKRNAKLMKQSSYNKPFTILTIDKTVMLIIAINTIMRT